MNHEDERSDGFCDRCNKRRPERVPVPPHHAIGSQYRTTRNLSVRWGPGHTPLSDYDTIVPKGHPCFKAGRDGNGRWSFFADPNGLIDRAADPMRWHDATHYGIRVAEADVEEVA